MLLLCADFVRYAVFVGDLSLSSSVASLVVPAVFRNSSLGPTYSRFLAGLLVALLLSFCSVRWLSFPSSLFAL